MKDVLAKVLIGIVLILFCQYVDAVDAIERGQITEGTILKTVESLPEAVKGTTMSIEKGTVNGDLKVSITMLKAKKYPNSISPFLKGMNIAQGQINVNYKVENHKIKVDENGQYIIDNLESGSDDVVLEKEVEKGTLIDVFTETIKIAPNISVPIIGKEYITSGAEGAVLRRKNINEFTIKKGTASIQKKP